MQWFLIILVVALSDGKLADVAKSTKSWTTEEGCQAALPNAMVELKTRLEKVGYTIANAKCVSQDQLDAADPKNGVKL